MFTAVTVSARCLPVGMIGEEDSDPDNLNIKFRQVPELYVLWYHDNMEKYDYLIIGGGIAGVTAAETVRENDPQGTIGIISDEPHLLYSRVLLPSFLKKRIRREQIFLRSAEDFSVKNIEILLEEKVGAVDVGRKEVLLSNRRAFSYNKLLVASGGRVTPWVPEGDPPYVYRLQTLDDADRILRGLEKITRPVVIGSSFISLEFLEIFVLNKTNPFLLVRGSHFFENFLDPQGGEILRDNFEKHGITTQFSDVIGGVNEHDATLRIFTKGFRDIEGDALALGIGIQRNVDFLLGSGVKLGKKGVIVNEFLETDAADVFAAGDVAEFFDVILGKHHIVGNWTSAFLQGKCAGLNMVGQKTAFKGVSSYSITNLGFQITALGECNNELESVIRQDKRKNQYGRFFIKDGILVGAALINRFRDKTHLMNLIASQTNIEEHKDQLKDFTFDIHTIQT